MPDGGPAGVNDGGAGGGVTGALRPGDPASAAGAVGGHEYCGQVESGCGAAASDAGAWGTVGSSSAFRELSDSLIGACLEFVISRPGVARLH